MAALRILAVTVLFGACTPVQPQRSTLPPGETAPVQPDEDEAVVCKEETPTGSNISRQVCRTEAVRQEDRDNVTRTMEERRPCGQCGGTAQPLAGPLPGPPGSIH